MRDGELPSRILRGIGFHNILAGGDEHGFYVQVLVEDGDVGALAGGEGAAVVQLCRAGGDDGGRLDGRLQRDAEGDGAAHGLADVDAAAGDGAIQQAGHAAGEADGQAAQLVFAVRHPRAAQGVRDQRQAAGEDGEGHAHGGGVDVQAVADDLRAGAGVEGRADDARLAVVDGRHGVEEVGGVAGAQGVGVGGGVVIGLRVADGHGAETGCAGDEGLRALHLGGHGDHAHRAAGSGVQPLEHIGVRRVEVVRVLRAALVVGEEGPFKMHARAAGRAGVPRVAHGVHGARELRLLERHGGGEEAGDAVARVVVRQHGHGGGVAVRKVAVHGAVGVDIDKAGDDIAAGGVIAAFAEAARGLDELAEAEVAVREALAGEVDPAVFYDHLSSLLYNLIM